ncbi:EpsG family protein [Spirosoma fluviale]|uniref:EpsG family protein n=2 Tax=Spirosoma fluviale TaxID=1597977 RepID=A0A286G3Q2_9BACT|nr:EpsG family protein [Spirosoma fluviale]
MVEPETYILYTLLMGSMLLFSLPSAKAVVNERTGLITFPHYWGPNLVGLIILYSFIIGCRYYVGIDYKVYVEIFLELKETGIVPREIEFGYELLNVFLNYLNVHFTFIFIIMAFFQMFFFYKALEKFPFILPWFTFFFFVSLMMFSSMNIMRQSLAWFVFFYALNLAIEKKWGWVLVCIFFGYSFHKTMVIGVLTYPLLFTDIAKNKYVQIGILLVVTALASSILTIVLAAVSPLVNLMGYGYYIDNLDYMYEITAEGKVGAGTANALFFVVDIAIMWYSPELKENFKKYDFYKYYNLYFVGAILDRIVSDNFIMARTNDYLLNFRVVIMSFFFYFLFNTQTQKVVKRIFGYTISFIMVAFFYKAIYNRAADNSPFRFVFMEDRLQTRPQKLSDY